MSLLALWGFATVSTAQEIARLGQVRQIDATLRTPLAASLTELQAERRAAVRFLADPASDQGPALEQQARRTDDAVKRLRLGDRHTVADSGEHPTEVVTRLGAFVTEAEALATARKDVAARRMGADAAYATYTRVADAALAAEGALSGGERPALGPEFRVLLEFARAGEMLSREDALLAVPGTPRTAETLRLLAGAVETRRALATAAARDLPGAPRAAWDSVTRSAAYGELTTVEDETLAAYAPTGTGTGTAAKDSKDLKDPKDAKDARGTGTPAGWDAAYASVGSSLREIAEAAHARAVGGADPFTEGALSPAGAAVLLGLAAVAASLVISVRIGRALVVELVSLRNTALEIAHRKLPHAMDRLRSGQGIDVAAEAPAPPAAEDEITQVGAALSTVHRAALSAAVERAELADGISGVFVNLARRSQVLVHKQLNLLDSMERRADDPGELGDLFRLDHLTTRMRRHAESLIILSGAAPGRAWRTPVPLTNVVRAAVSEIEDYPRVEVRGLAEAAVVGTAVADLTHLLAELIENAAQFSPPHTKVRVSGEGVGAGYVLEVEDRGLGMGREALAEANRRIEQSEDLDLFDSDRLGLFVVSRLSARHGVRVHLRTSPYGGTTAVVLLPNALLQAAIEPAPGAAPQPEREPAPAPERPERPEPRLAPRRDAATEGAGRTRPRCRRRGQPRGGAAAARLGRHGDGAAAPGTSGQPRPAAARGPPGDGRDRRTPRRTCAGPQPGRGPRPDGRLPRRMGARLPGELPPRRQRRRSVMIEHHRIGLDGARRPGELDWLLDDMVTRVREVRHAVVLSNDGLAVGSSSALSREDAEHLAAVASGFHSLAKGAGRHFHAGGVRQTMVEMDEGFLFVAAAGDGSCLAVLSAAGADIGLIAYEMARLVKRVGEHLYTPPRTAVRPPAFG
ncbi:nitrate- and nitrite sensing domain-containing protein [Streptomyces sp. RerS4]|uniref:nitrate- and nitrite sensing domain-containing protein n=1 Tax=Streptomyces sp. RerS4 TaxID=2942449 RepID=UPI00201BF3D5|nr:nitrate- and nitrite sensing domain-containing protein [Streptomyces sp. RerS4]UQW99994.1 roadblock/LC7 domain-containing protein [Streptomyces sp. RerS4]